MNPMQEKRRLSLCKWLCCALTAMLPVGLLAENDMFPGAPPGAVESGAPSYFILGSEALGLSTAPSDLHLLPDGRILVVSQREIAIGDGVRWETFQEASDQTAYIYQEVAVDDDGRIYAGIAGSITQIVLGPDGRWRFAPVVSVPYDDPYMRVSQYSDHWLWYSGDAVVSWRPGKALEVSRLPASLQYAFPAGQEQFASDISSGTLYKLHFGGETEPVAGFHGLPSDVVTCSFDFGGQTLLGTKGNGLYRFDNSAFRSADVPKCLGPGSHIDDVCRIEAEYYAAAVDSVGIVFFGKDGRIVQILSRTLDHRLSRVHKLVYSHGVLWALLDSGVACVQFPSPISNYELMLNGAMRYTMPLRHQGKLWIMADGRMMRGAYDADGCLDHFELDSPPGRFIWSTAEVKDRLFAASDQGIYVRTGTSWQLAAEDVPNARLGMRPASEPGKFFYAARGEIGWIKESAGHYAAERIPIEGLGDVYSSAEDAEGTIWLELGTERVGRVTFPNGKPTFSFFGKQDGLADGWIGVFQLSGKAHCISSSHQMQRFDAASQRFVGDQDLIRRIPALEASTGRPSRDAFGRIWFTSNGSLRYFDEKTGQGGSLPLDFQPDSFFMETNGVIWMPSLNHLVRYDPRTPNPAPSPLRAKITSVQLSASKHYSFSTGHALVPIKYEDNSLVMHFCSASNLFGPPVSFDVMLEGGSKQWTTTGTVGSASFNHLKEGSYVFHVRAMTAGVQGEEDRLAFTVLPPWYRTWWAWACYTVSAIGLLILIGWLISYWERREKTRLERLVAQRTADLAGSEGRYRNLNAQLAKQVEEITEKTDALTVSEGRYRQLNAELEDRVRDRTSDLSKTNADLKLEIGERQKAVMEVERIHKELLAASHQAGMAEVAIGVLHNVGNVLNSVNVSAEIVAERVRGSKASGVAKLSQLLEGQSGRLAQFLTEDSRGRAIPAYLKQLAAHLDQEKQILEKELRELLGNVDHIKDIVAMQQSYAKVSGFNEKVSLADLVEDAIKMNGGAYTRHGVALVRDYETVPPVNVDRHKVLQILVNLLQNSKYACDAANQPVKRVTVRIRAAESDRCRVEISDTGIGIPPENMGRIFTQGFTTRKNGHGFGLHSAALAARQMGGTLAAHSEGVGHGATFTLEIPITPSAS
jgi:signal transduction histidine kinase